MWSICGKDSTLSCLYTTSRERDNVQRRLTLPFEPICRSCLHLQCPSSGSFGRRCQETQKGFTLSS